MVYDLAEWVERYDYSYDREDPEVVARRMSTAHLLRFLSDVTIWMFQTARANWGVCETAREAVCRVLGERIDAGAQAAERNMAPPGPTCGATPNVPMGFPGAGVPCQLAPGHDGEHQIDFRDGRSMRWASSSTSSKVEMRQ